MQSLRMRVSGFALLVGLMLSGCATPSRTSVQTNAPQWQGRLSVQVLGDAPSAMSAGFLLRGNAQNGELDLYSPLGITLGALQWTPQRVQFTDGSKQQDFSSLAELTEKTTGAALPIEAIFAWLQGRQATAPGWWADLTAASQGSLVARRTAPAPEVLLKIKLEP